MKSTYELSAWDVRRRIPSATSTITVVYEANEDRIQHDSEGIVTPEYFTYVEVPNDPVAPVYVIEFVQEDEGAPRVKDFHVHQRNDGGREIRSADLRRFRPLEDVLEDAWAAVSSRRTDSTPASEIVQPFELEREFADKKGVVRGLRRQARRRVTDDVLREVAEVYEANLATQAPTRAVKEHFGLADSTASLYVKKARDRGYLKPATPKEGGGS